MKKRVCVNRTKKEKLALLRRWKVDNPDWTIQQAAVELKVKEATLRGWVKRYWDVCDKEVGSDRKRDEGGGRKHKMKPYEWRVIEYLDELVEDNWTFDDVMFYCQNLEEFNADFNIPESQVTWVRRFIQRYTANAISRVPPTTVSVTPADGGVARGDDVEHEDDGGGGSVTPAGGRVTRGDDVEHEDDGGGGSVTPAGGGVTRGDDVEHEDDGGGGSVTPAGGGVARGDDVEHEEDGSKGENDGGVTRGDGSEHEKHDGVTPVDGGVPSDEDSYDSAESNESDSGSEGVDCNDSEESEYEVPISAKKTPMPPRQSAARSRKQKAIIEWARGDDTSWIYPEDLDSLMPYQTLTESAVDYFVHGFMPREKGLIFCRGTSFFRTVKTIKRTKEKAERDERLDGHIGSFDWGSYRFVILPVHGNAHWSFLVVENPLRGGDIRLYHVNSATEAHNTTDVFSLMQWWLVKERIPLTASVGSVKWGFHACPTKPQQHNSVDCGIYLLYFMEKISAAITKDRPRTLLGSMDKLCSDKFNVENYRALLHQRIIAAANVANKRSKFFLNTITVAS